LSFSAILFAGIVPIRFGASLGMNFFAMCSPGLEGMLATELKSLGARIGQGVAGGVEFRGSRQDLWRANLWSRLASRIVVRVDEFHASSFHELERRAKKVDWSQYLAPARPVRFRVTSRKSKLYHSDAVAERLGNAAVRAGAVVANDSDDEENESDAQLFIVRLANDMCSVSADSSGELLHRRGYRQAVAKAPLRETLAAAMLIGCGWDSKSPLVDPMCGSGTIAIEGAMMARNMAPGAHRTFAFESWPDHHSKSWKAMVDEAVQAQLDRSPARIIASDRDAGGVTATISNARRAQVLEDIEIQNRSISDAEFPSEAGWIVSNPPYGLRVGDSNSLRDLYAKLGSIVRERARGYVLALLSADKSLESQLGMKLKEVFRTSNGGIPVRLVAGKAD
jgi:putative N6-adenine-specific DNA methylase